MCDKAQQLEGYHGDLRQDTAEIIIPRRFIGSASNDIGFKLQEDGTYGAIISDYDRTSMKYNQDWIGKLSQRYSYHKLKDDLSTYGYSVESEQSTNQGEIVLNVVTYGGY